MPRRYLLFFAPVVLLATALTATSLAAPTARFSVTPDDPRTGEPVRFDALASSCDAAPCSYTWSDDGPDGPGGTSWPLGTGQDVRFTFRYAGTKRIRLTVRNADGESSATTRAITVAAGPRPDDPDPDADARRRRRRLSPRRPRPRLRRRRLRPQRARRRRSRRRSRRRAAGDAICLADRRATARGRARTRRSSSVPQQAPARTMRFSFGSGDDGVHARRHASTRAARSAAAREHHHPQQRVHRRRSPSPARPPSANILFDGNSHNNISGNATAQPLPGATARPDDPQQPLRGRRLGRRAAGAASR